MPVNKMFAIAQNEKIDDLAKDIGKRLISVMHPNLAYTRDEVQRMINEFAEEDKERGQLIKAVPWYKFIGGDKPIEIYQGSADPYYGIK